MKNYENRDNFRSRLHTVEITFQLGVYKGTVTKKIGGNCFGLDILECVDLDSIFEDMDKNNCNLQLLEPEEEDGELWYSIELKDDDGNETSMEDELSQLKSLVVKVEIIDCIIEDK